MCLCVLRYNQGPSLDYKNNNDVTVRLVLLCWLTNRAWNARVYDIETAFLSGDLKIQFTSRYYKNSTILFKNFILKEIASYSKKQNIVLFKQQGNGRENLFQLWLKNSSSRKVKLMHVFLQERMSISSYHPLYLC
jgi:hypothetical protein